MNDRACVELLQWALPELGLRFRGFKNVRRQVCRRISARASALGLDAQAYRERLASDPEERRAFDALCHVTISRFYRDRRVFDALGTTLLPELAELARASGGPLRVWSAGCASGEEPYSVAILWHLEVARRFPGVAIEIVATDYDELVLARAARAAFEESSLREIPQAWRDAAFERSGDLFVVRPSIRSEVTFARGDIRVDAPPAPLHLVLCRNAAFTYFDEAAQVGFLQRVAERLVPRGLLVVGAHEAVPATAAIVPSDVAHVFRRR